MRQLHLIVTFDIANLSNFQLPKSTSDLYNDLYWTSVKLHKSSSRVGFVKKCLYLNVLPKLAVLREQFSNESKRHTTERNLLVSHSTNHVSDLKELLLKHRKNFDGLKSPTCLLLFNIFYSNILRTSRFCRLAQETFSTATVERYHQKQTQHL